MTDNGKRPEPELLVRIAERAALESAIHHLVELPDGWGWDTHDGRLIFVAGDTGEHFVRCSTMLWARMAVPIDDAIPPDMVLEVLRAEVARTVEPIAAAIAAAQADE